MTGLVEVRGPFESTSAAGAMFKRHAGAATLVGRMLAGFGTSGLIVVDTLDRVEIQQTSAGSTIIVVKTVAGSIADLRRISGLTWEQIARLFDVSRRALHFWASGKPSTADHEERLQRLVAALRTIDRGSASETRSALLAVLYDGSSAFDLLANREYDRAVKLLGRGTQGARVATKPVSHQAIAARAPRPPEELVGALHDRVARKAGIVRAAKSARARSGR